MLSKNVYTFIGIIFLILISTTYITRPEFLQIKRDIIQIEESDLKTVLSKSSASEEVLKKVFVNTGFCEKKGYIIDKGLSSDSLDPEGHKLFIMYEYKFLKHTHPTIYCIEEK